MLTARSPTGEEITTRARVVELSDGRLGMWSEDIVPDRQAVRVRAEGPDSPGLAGTVDVVRSGRSFNEARTKLRRKYGRRARVSHLDAVLLLRT